MYVAREMQDTVLSYLNQFKVVLVTGPRQVGKTTMLRHMLRDRYAYVTLDDIDLLVRIQDDSALFLMENEHPIIID